MAASYHMDVLPLGMVRECTTEELHRNAHLKDGRWRCGFELLQHDAGERSEKKSRS